MLFASQYEDVESGWAYNRFRYYNPTLGAYNAQDPLGLVPKLSSAQGYVDHAAFWVDVLGLHGCWAAKKVQGKVVYQQTGRQVFNPHKEVYLPREIGGGIGINVDLMRHGRAPIGVDGNPVNLHHIGQDDRSAVVEITKQMHAENAKVLHIFHGMNRSEFPTDVTPVDRASFREWRHTYWKEIALDYL